jgi:5-methylcytosine-specific restriction endonuclease McrA
MPLQAERKLTMNVSLDINVELAVSEDSIAGLDEVHISDAFMDSERLVFAAWREWRKMSRRNNKSHGRHYAIYDRNNWICQLCLEPVDRRLKVTHPHGPTIDHIIPQSRGGTSVSTNLQLAHAICNHVRGDLPMELVDHEVFKAVKVQIIRWLAAQERFREAEAKRERARRKWEGWCRRARSGKTGGLRPTYIPSLKELSILFGV